MIELDRKVVYIGNVPYSEICCYPDASELIVKADWTSLTGTTPAEQIPIVRIRELPCKSISIKIDLISPKVQVRRLLVNDVDLDAHESGKIVSLKDMKPESFAMCVIYGKVEIPLIYKPSFAVQEAVQKGSSIAYLQFSEKFQQARWVQTYCTRTMKVQPVNPMNLVIKTGA